MDKGKYNQYPSFTRPINIYSYSLDINGLLSYFDFMFIAGERADLVSISMNGDVQNTLLCVLCLKIRIPLILRLKLSDKEYRLGLQYYPHKQRIECAKHTR